MTTFEKVTKTKLVCIYRCYLRQKIKRCKTFGNPIKNQGKNHKENYVTKGKQRDTGTQLTFTVAPILDFGGFMCDSKISSRQKMVASYERLRKFITETNCNRNNHLFSYFIVLIKNT